MTILHFGLLAAGFIIGFSLGVLFWSCVMPDCCCDDDDFWND